MKTYRQKTIRQAEIAQVILLHRLYMQPGSHDLIFQGGTAIRWCYGGSRFSEDLDFVTPLDPFAVRKILDQALKGVEKTMIPHFGVGSLTLTDKSKRDDTLKLYADFRPEASREKISIKLEFEGMVKDRRPETKNHVLSSLPAVSYLIAAGEFRVPRPNAVIVTETSEELLSDKVRSLLERPYIKGRDFYDVWHLRSILNIEVDPGIVERKFSLYRSPFTARRAIEDFVAPSAAFMDAMKAAIERDLFRFLPPEVLAVHQGEGFAVFLEAVRVLFRDVREKGVSLP